MIHFSFMLAVVAAGIQKSGVLAADTQSPSYNCLGGPVFGLESACDFTSFDGLQSHPASEILYQIIQQSSLPNSTFFANDTHVTCLFRDTNFLLNGFGAGAGPITFTIGGIRIAGTLCVSPKGVDKGGLTLGEIHLLARELIGKSGCGQCGRISANYLTKNESQLGWLEFDWRSNPICQDNCIDPRKDVKPTGTPSANTSRSAAGRTFGATGDGGFVLTLYLVALVALGAGGLSSLLAL